MNWDKLGFSIIPTDYMYIMSCSNYDDNFMFENGNLTPYGNIEISPSSGILNYGQGLLEGLKAYRGEDNHIRLFRPEENALRMQIGADRMCMPSPSIEQFVDAVKQVALANKRWIPPLGKGSLYIRPLLMGTGPVLGVRPAPECTFLLYASPVGNYSKGPLDLLVEEHFHRAMPGGTGGIKTITNYSPVYKASSEARAKGFSDVLFLDAETGKYIEEGTACNVFVVKGNLISTPAITGTILSGITRKSIIEIALSFGYQVEERAVPLEELVTADEAFCTGTAMVIKAVSSVTYRGKRIEYKTGEDTVSQKFYATLTGIQTGCVEDKKGWSVIID
ncbi:branched-chain amino acid aminotransferase 1, mitochondrial-like isoform X2 [Mercurialis annua]|nr:branched-chain amino acid aminotransferase 1, mitochondrial-like isoform X2 [Mercurialis annua]